MRHPGKRIYRRFRISNQIFGSIYGSRDIERSLDTTLAVFGENLNFMEIPFVGLGWSSDCLGGSFTKGWSIIDRPGLIDLALSYTCLSPT